MSQHLLQWKWKHSKKAKEWNFKQFQMGTSTSFLFLSKDNFLVHLKMHISNFLLWTVLSIGRLVDKHFHLKKIHWFSEYLLDLFFCGFYFFSPEAHISYHDPHAHTQMPTSETPFSLKTTYTVQCVLMFSILLIFLNVHHVSQSDSMT